MRIIINENQLNLIRETIDPSEAYSNIESVQTIIDGKRNVAMVAGLSHTTMGIIADMVNEHDLDSVRVPSNKHGAFIIFKKGSDEQAHKLLSIAEKYGGYLSHEATDDDVREIGRLLEYNPESVEDFILNSNK